MDFVPLRERLRLARKERDFTLDEAAAASGLNRATIHSIENIKREPDLKPELETIEQLARAYGLALSASFTEIPGSHNQDLKSTLAHAHNRPTSSAIPSDTMKAAPDASAVSEQQIDSLGLEVALVGLTAAITQTANRLVKHFQRPTAPRARAPQRRPRSDSARKKAS